MPRTGFSSVDEYIAAQPAASQKALAQVRRAIRSAIPEAEETISYKMPTYKIGGEAALYFAGWKKHFSIYPASKRLLAEFADQLTEFKVDKSTIRFPLSAPVPIELLEEIAKFRAREVSERKS
jgi:uncharacterized protein YdhG (YjbR/CyaY superfamily)